MAVTAVLPRPVGFADPAMEAWANLLVETMQISLDNLALPAIGGFAVSGNSTRTTLNPSTDTLTQGVTGTVRGDARSPQYAQEVHDALEGFLGLGRMMAPKNQPELLGVFDGIRVAQEGQRVIVNIQEPADLAGQFLDRWLKP